MAQSTVNLQKMKSVASELDKIYKTMTNNMVKLDEAVYSLAKIWAGEGMQAYLQAYKENSNDFVLLAESVHSCSVTLTTATNAYGKADMAAAEAIKAKMAKG